MKIVYWVGTGLLSLVMIFSATMYFTNTAAIQEAFTGFGYPSYLVIPLGIVKLLGLVAIISNRSATLKEWAYFGFLIDLILAIAAHLAVKDGQSLFAIAALAGWIASYVGYKKM